MRIIERNKNLIQRYLKNTKDQNKNLILNEKKLIAKVIKTDGDGTIC